MNDHRQLDSASLSEVIQMALSDHVSFAQIRSSHTSERFSIYKQSNTQRAR